MKVEELKNALGIGSIVDEKQCIFLKSVQNWYEKLQYNEELIIYFNSIQGGNYVAPMRNYKYVYSCFSRGRELIFYELYEIQEEITVKEAVKRKLFPVEIYQDKIHKINVESSDPYFILKKIETPGNLERRLIIENSSGQATRMRYDTISQYEVLAIEKPRTATNFNSYDEVYLNYNELQQVINDSQWQDVLSRFGGVYLINDQYTGKNYIGSAYNEGEGILGRWKNYANNPTGGSDDEGNKMLVELLNKGMHGNDTGLTGKDYASKYFKYSILEVLPLGNKNRILEAEKRWKQHLGTKSEKHGLNAN